MLRTHRSRSFFHDLPRAREERTPPKTKAPPRIRQATLASRQAGPHSRRAPSHNIWVANAQNLRKIYFKIIKNSLHSLFEDFLFQFSLDFERSDPLMKRNVLSELEPC